MSAVPNGFHVADRLQVEAFEATGSIPGAAKVTYVGLSTLCARLRPPRWWDADLLKDYNDGWRDGKAARPAREHTGGDLDTGYAAGYRDAAENRMKWHLAHCSDHGDHESGCGA